MTPPPQNRHCETKQEELVARHRQTVGVGAATCARRPQPQVLNSSASTSSVSY